MPLAIPQRLLNGLLRDKRLMWVPWPAHSPDMNPIDNLWGILKEELRKKADLVWNITLFWCNSQEIREACKSLSHSMTERGWALLGAKGHQTKY